MDKKYEIIKDDHMDIICDNYITKVYRIRALKDFGDVKKGDIGGYIQKESNLSHEGNCWIYNEAVCWQCGRVLNNSKLMDYTEIYGSGVLKDNAIVKGRCVIKDCSTVSGFLILDGNVRTVSNARVYGFGNVKGTYTFDTFTRIHDGNIQTL